MKQEEKTERTKSRIFDAAMKEFGANGYTAGSINNICKTGINKGLIYHNFKNKDELYLECVAKSCREMISCIKERGATEGFVEYMNARKEFFSEHEAEACIFLEARTNPPHSLAEPIGEIYAEFDELNRLVLEKELSKHTLRKGVSKEDAMKYFSAMQKLYNLDFLKGVQEKMPPHDQLELHELNIYKIFDFMLYGIAEGGEKS
ncbi:MAG: TetR/AcrR family transcriptional regulator [Lachnospiraceae bacterium]|nr:TetR/AcrR family transcriptional regulator [Lachnospiraceae bacterium]MDY4971201.1 TetR/AcrR family transcriptional regulator [Lachnospiraceae bacterium]